jgi:hypothetical protein
MAVSKRVRFEVFKRDAFTCRYCGRKPPEVMLHCDHVIPVAADGPDDPANLVTSCVACNLGKSDKPLGQVMPAIDEMVLLEGMQEALEAATSLRSSAEAARVQREAEDAAIDMVRGAYIDALDTDKYFQIASVRRFLQKIGPESVLGAIDSTASASEAKGLSDYAAWKYFCAVCWRRVSRAEGKISVCTICGKDCTVPPEHVGDFSLTWAHNDCIKRKRRQEGG